MPAEGLTEKTVNGVIGREDDFPRLSQAVLSLDLTGSLLGWAFVAKPSQLSVGSTICTVTRFYGLPLWSINPCRITSMELIAGQHAKVIYETVLGHMLQGRESLEVRVQSDVVVLEVMSTAKGCGWLGRVLMPIIAPLQTAFLQAHVPGAMVSSKCPATIIPSQPSMQGVGDDW